MPFNQCFRIFDYEIKDNLIYYNRKKKYSGKKNIKTMEMGILIYRIHDWSNDIKILSEIYKFSLIDYFSIQIVINNDKYEIFLLMRIIGIAINELESKYKKIKEKFDNEDLSKNLMTESNLEKVFLSIFGKNSPNLKTIFANSKFIKSKNGFFLQNKDNTLFSGNYFFLTKLNTEKLLESTDKMELLVGILYSAKIQGNIIFQCENMGTHTNNSCYFFNITDSIQNNALKLQKKLNNFNFNIKNIFHPEYIDKILLRNKLDKKNLCKSKTPSIFSIQINSQTFNKNNNNEINSNALNYENSRTSLQIGESGRNNSIKINEFLKILNEDDSNSIAKNFQSDNIEDLIRKYDRYYSKISNYHYILFNNTVILYEIESISNEILNSMIKSLKKPYKNYIFYFRKLTEFNNFKLKLKLNEISLKKIDLIHKIDDLINVLEKKPLIEQQKPLIQNV